MANRNMSRVNRAIAMANALPRKRTMLMVDINKLRLNVKRGLILNHHTFCICCGNSTGILTQYRDSNFGVVVLCTKCKVVAFENSFGHADAMPLKVNHAHAKRE